MRIVSKFKDYYDGAGKDFGKDSTCFVRHTEEINPDKNITDQISLWRYGKYNANRFGIDHGIIGFCGKIYPFITNDYNSDTTKACFNIEECQKLNIDESQYIYEPWSRPNEIWFDQYKNPNSAIYRIFKQFNTAYFLIINSGPAYKYIKYPILRQYGFYRIFDTQQAYQEIEMYLGNVLHPRDNPYIAPVPDTIKAESHGFDKWSFRKEPSSWRRSNNE